MTVRDQDAPQCPACGAFLPNDTGHVDRISRWLDPTAILPIELDHTDLGLDSAVFEGFLRSFRIDSTQKARTLEQTYRLVQRYLAPFVVKVVVDMTADLVRAIDDDPGTTVVFLGRDGFVFGFVLSVLAPDFYARHCVPMYLPRPLADAALRDLESWTGSDFSAIEAFRRRSSAPTGTAGAWQQLTAYFELSGIDIDGGDVDLCLVDSGLKGSVQEMLTAAYPAASFFGHYAFFAASAHDPHPGTKRGHALHLDGHHSADGLALQGDLPEDPELTFHHHEAIVAIEGMISGSKSSPTGYGTNGRPRARRHRHDERPLDGINPALVAPEHADPYVREAIFAMNVIAIVHYARTLAPTVTAAGPEWYRSAEGTRWYKELSERSDLLRDQVRAWVARSDAADPGFARLLDSFIPRADKDDIRDLDERLRSADLTDEQRQGIWRTVTQLYRR
ncbi:hypothetical protein IU486_30850 [Streptomyces gardneri]|nr:hypothetical protein [Streptomyces gardneri]